MDSGRFMKHALILVVHYLNMLYVPPGQTLITDLPYTACRM